MHFKTLILALPLTLTAGLAAQDEAPKLWHDDFDAAVAAAKESGKDLLVDFTGSDWCGWCIKLDEEVFSTDEFITKAPEMFELVKLDYPRGEEVKAKVPNPERNQELSEKYGIQGFPTVLAMTADGLVFGRTGYAAGGPTPYLENLGKMLSEGKQRVMAAKTLASQFKVADAELRATMLPQLLEVLDGVEGDDPAVELLGEHVEAAMASGELEKAGLLEKGVVILLATGKATDAVCAAARKIDPKNEKGMLDSVVNAQFAKVQDDATARAALEAFDGLLEVGVKDGELEKRLLFTAVRWTAQPLDDKERARTYFAKFEKVAGEEEAEMIKFCKQLLGDG